MIHLNETMINEALIKIKPGLQKYMNIQNLLHKVDVSTCGDFQKAFNGFYRIRQRPKKFYEVYYEFLESNKTNQQLSFEATLLYLSSELGRIEASFASKLVATINPTLPVWDSVVLKNLKIKAPLYSDKNRISKILERYDLIQERYSEFLVSEEGSLSVGLFDQKYPDNNLSRLKKVDLILWQIRE